MTTPILVTGGTGHLGSHLVPLLRAAEREVRVLSRHPRADEPGLTHVAGDTRRGDGLDAALAGVDTVVHLAGGASGDDDAARHLAAAARAAGTRHLVLISVIGADRMPIGYFRAKAAAESAIADSGVPFTILRAAQFHTFVLRTIGAMARMPLVPAPGGLRFEPVDTAEVAQRLCELALAAPAGRVADLAGPEVLDVPRLVSTLAEARGHTRRLLPIRMPGAVGRAYRAGENLAGPTAQRGSRSWEEFLAGATSVPSTR
jgi:uncharacterized protein YbjT (DUF2867 family)